MGYFDSPFQAIAHRGGARHPANIGRENTARAFQTAVDLGFRYLETDVHATRDGRLVAFHDDRLDRVTDLAGKIRELPYDVVAQARVGGDCAVPLMAELLDRFPQARFNIDLKGEGTAPLLAAAIRAAGAQDRVLVTSFSGRRLAEFRAIMGDSVPYGASTADVARSLTACRLGVGRYPSGVSALQIPLRRNHLQVFSRRLLDGAHRAGLRVHVWTIDDADAMNELIEAGVDGIMTDRPDVLRQVLAARGMW
ncbi:MAG: glycerophosphodiester phosphodiesterase [Propionibacteriaceae bacterium]|nr:glycerophosphodiester phosphodiesterase [Propionibacteriaceae bacterium]